MTITCLHVLLPAADAHLLLAPPAPSPRWPSTRTPAGPSSCTRGYNCGLGDGHSSGNYGVVAENVNVSTSAVAVGGRIDGASSAPGAIVVADLTTDGLLDIVVAT